MVIVDCLGLNLGDRIPGPDAGLDRW